MKSKSAFWGKLLFFCLLVRLTPPSLATGFHSQHKSVLEDASKRQFTTANLPFRQLSNGKTVETLSTDISNGLWVKLKEIQDLTLCDPVEVTDAVKTLKNGPSFVDEKSA